MNIEERVRILEEQVRGLVSARTKDKIYTDADINGTRQSVANITPTTFTKTAYYGESEKVFYDAPEGNVLVFFDNYNGPYAVNRVANRLTISFDPLKETTNITLSIQ